MKKLNKIYNIIPIAVIILSFTYLVINRDELRFIRVQGIDLSRESINGISLMDKFDLSSVEKAFGKSEKVTFVDTNAEGYAFNSEKCDAAIGLDKNNNITSIAGSTLKDTLYTGKCITLNKSSFDDIIEAYGINYLKVISKDSERGNKETGYSITYIDKKNNYKLEFDIFEFKSKEEIQNIRLWKYK